MSLVLYVPQKQKTQRRWSCHSFHGTLADLEVPFSSQNITRTQKTQGIVLCKDRQHGKSSATKMPWSASKEDSPFSELIACLVHNTSEMATLKEQAFILATSYVQQAEKITVLIPLASDPAAVVGSRGCDKVRSSLIRLLEMFFPSKYAIQPKAKTKQHRNGAGMHHSCG